MTIDQGQSVTWNNSGGGNHNVHFEDGTLNGVPSTSNWTYTRTFSAPGQYKYYCDVHNTLGMSGTVVVNAGTQPTTQPGSTQPGSGTPTSPGYTIDTVAPRLTTKLQKVQRVLRRRAVVLSVVANEPASVSATGRVSLPGPKAVGLRPARKRAAAAARARLDLKLSKKALGRLRRALRNGARLPARITVTARDAAGNSRVRKLKLRLQA